MLVAVWSVFCVALGAWGYGLIWSGRLMPRRKITPIPPAHGQLTRHPDEDRKDAAEAEKWINPTFSREDYLKPSGTMEFNPKDLRGRGSAFQK